MILHHTELSKLSLTTYPPLQYSDEYTFLPFKSNKQDILLQTPRLFVPFGIQENDNGKQFLMISFQNKTNDTHTLRFLNDLQSIYKQVYSKYKQDYIINSFLKTYGSQKETIMNMKFKEGSLIYDCQKQCRDEFPIYSYASFIVHLSGLWIYQDQMWFQWIVVQARLENDVCLSSYAFKDIPKVRSVPPPPPPPPPPSIDKYKKMISMGIPTQAVNHQKQIDRKASINSRMLQSVQLKKASPQTKQSREIPDGFQPPTLDTLQLALRKLRSIITEK